MRPASKKSSFGQDLVEAIKSVLAHHCGEIELEQVLSKRRVSKGSANPKAPRAK